MRTPIWASTAFGETWPVVWEKSKILGSVGYMTFEKDYHDDYTGWWFFDETGADMFGPYASEEEAHKACVAYAETI